MDSLYNVWFVLYFLFAHWVSDFVFQTEKMAEGKSKGFGPLFDHCWIYACSMSFFFILYSIFVYSVYSIDLHIGGFKWTLIWAPLFITHFFIDYITSRINSILYKSNEIHWFFVSVGFDQFLHYLTIFFTLYYFLKS